MLLLNTDSREAFEISPGDRIAQLLIVAVHGVRLDEVEQLDKTPRGVGGFGSTGR